MCVSVHCATENVSHQKVRHIYNKAVWNALRRNVRHQPVCADDAVFVAIC